MMLAIREHFEREKKVQEAMKMGIPYYTQSNKSTTYPDAFHSRSNLMILHPPLAKLDKVKYISSTLQVLTGKIMYIDISPITTPRDWTKYEDVSYHGTLPAVLL